MWIASANKQPNKQTNKQTNKQSAKKLMGSKYTNPPFPFPFTLGPNTRTQRPSGRALQHLRVPSIRVRPSTSLFPKALLPPPPPNTTSHIPYPFCSFPVPQPPPIPNPSIPILPKHCAFHTALPMTHGCAGRTTKKVSPGACVILRRSVFFTLFLLHCALLSLLSLSLSLSLSLPHTHTLSLSFLFRYNNAKQGTTVLCCFFLLL